jgi:hypothetical protein
LGEKKIYYIMLSHNGIIRGRERDGSSYSSHLEFGSFSLDDAEKISAYFKTKKGKILDWIKKYDQQRIESAASLPAPAAFVAPRNPFPQPAPAGRIAEDLPPSPARPLDRPQAYGIVALRNPFPQPAPAANNRRIADDLPPPPVRPPNRPQAYGIVGYLAKVAVRLLFYYSIFKGLSRLWKFWTDRR